MSNKNVKVNFQGKIVDGQEMNFKIKKEDWNEYEIEDGTILKVKTVMAKITKIKKFNKTGEPIYVFNTQNVASTNVPEELMKKD